MIKLVLSTHTMTSTSIVVFKNIQGHQSKSESGKAQSGGMPKENFKIAHSLRDAIWRHSLGCSTVSKVLVS